MVRLYFLISLFPIIFCVEHKNSQVERIVGGSPEVIENVPWAVQINIKHHYGTDLCGGALISPQFVVSAAHCFVSQNFDVKREKLPLVSLKAITVIIGSTASSVFQTRGQSMQKYQIEKISIYPDFRLKGIFDDIAILQLEINSTARIQEFIQLPRERHLPWEKCFVAGWGLIDNHKTRFFIRFYKSNTVILFRPEVLHKVSLEILSSRVCKNTWHQIDTQTQFCAIGRESSGLFGDSCAVSFLSAVLIYLNIQGDSGGPFYCFVKDKFLLAGVVTDSKICSYFEINQLYFLSQLLTILFYPINVHDIFLWNPDISLIWRTAGCRADRFIIFHTICECHSQL